MARKKPTTPDPVLAYAESVLAGETVAGRWVKLACQRHIDDLKRKDIVWDLAAAEYAIGFFKDVLRLNGGQFEGKPFILEPPQVFIVGSLLGWKLRDGRRRFNNAFIEQAKGGGKSPLLAGLGHYGLIADKEPRAEVYAAATKKDQAMILFRDAVAMRDQSPYLADRLQKSGVGEKCWNMADHKTGSWFRPISSEKDSQSGPRPHFALVDEVHEHKTRVVIDMLSAGFKWRKNPLLAMITNSGFDRETVCWEWHEYITKILKHTAENDRIFGFICCLDPCDMHWNEGQEQPVDDCPDCDDWRTEGPHWQKANPILDIIPGREYLRAQVQKAKDMPAEENTVRRLNFGYWTSSESRWMSMELWDSCNGAIDYDKLRGRSSVVGIDLAFDADLAAMVLFFPPDKLPLATKPQDGPAEVNYSEIDIERLEDDFIILPYFFMAHDNIKTASDRDRLPYDVWVRQGLIEATPGRVIDHEVIKQRLIALNDVYPIRRKFENGEQFHLIGYDPVNSREFALSCLSRYRLNMIQVYQTSAVMNEPMRQLARLVKAHKIRHGGNPVLRNHVDNLVTESDNRGNIRPSRRNNTTKHIDGVAALFDAMAVALRNTTQSTSRYETADMRFL